jgi:AraC-like DNA-binding protein
MGNSVLDQLRELGPGMRTLTLSRRRIVLHSMPTSSGYDIKTTNEYDWDGRRRGETPFTILQYTISGHGNLRYENKTYRISEGEAMLVLVPHNHRYWVETGGRWEFFWISMNGEDALRIHREVLLAAGPVLHLKPHTVDILSRCCLRYMLGEGELPGEASAIAYQASMALYDDVFAGHLAETGGTDSMRRVMQHIYTNLDKDLSVDELARVAGLSRAHFSRMFAASVGHPPAEFVLTERMRRAAKLLAVNAQVSVKEVATLTGIADANYFSKVFRRIYGASPTEFRTTGMYAASTIGNAG